MGKGRDSLSDGVSKASRSMSRGVASSSSSSSSGDSDRKVDGKSSETSDSLRPEDQHQPLPWQQEPGTASGACYLETG